MHEDLIFSDGPMVEVARRLGLVARLDTTVLLLGESGTGKELAARFLHQNHPTRQDGRLVRVNCGAIPESLLESEFFGHVRGAFTGADRDREGVFEQADGGTLFLDEIDTMTPDAQVRLLRVLQERVVTRVGSSRPVTVNVRVVTASNEDLRKRVELGSFRRDLYYRVGVFPILLPPLRERRSELTCLVEALSTRIAGRMGLTGPKRFSTDALGSMKAYEWPGNVRELENAIEHTYVLAGEREEIRRDDLPSEIGQVPPAASETSTVQLGREGLSLRVAVTSFERDLILQSLRLADGNKARAARLLGLKRTTFLEKLRRVKPVKTPPL